MLLFAAIHQVHPDSLGSFRRQFDRLAGGTSLREAVLGGQDPFDDRRRLEALLAEWMRHRQPALLYP